ncbi:hypothetical protein AGJ02_14665 [Cronobacter sakazakii]|nr:hypothetical protein [Cronobacter sakazakii]EGZ6998757.1 hypothetical protein [Cronobacter sakazakii]EGZ7011106.1 hypothetical protein [Cronobacter sakazakii]EGZ7015318.1 hypothetical protein [Cronobacter sakazakii]EGZ7017997.1 hypothetical protein [Cronobacter sakazakii]
MNKKTDYRAIVERIAEILHGSVMDVDLLTITVQAMKERNKKLERQRQLSFRNDRAINEPTVIWSPAERCDICVEGARGGCSSCVFNQK